MLEPGNGYTAPGPSMFMVSCWFDRHCRDIDCRVSDRMSFSNSDDMGSCHRVILCFLRLYGESWVT